MVAVIAQARLLGATELGVLALLTLSAGLLASVGACGMGPLLTGSVAASRRNGDVEGAGRTTYFALLVCGTALSISGVLVVLVSIQSWFPWGDLTGSKGANAVLVAAWSVAVGLNPILVSAVVGFGEFRASSCLVSARALLVGVGSILGAILGRTALGAGLGALCGEAVLLVSGICYLTLRRQIRARHRGLWREGRHLVRQSVLSGLAGIAIQLGMWVGQVLVSRSADGLVASGLFLLMARLVLMVTLVPNAVGTVALPNLAGAIGLDGHDAAPRRYRRLTLLTAVPVAAAVAVASDLLLPKLDERYGSFGFVIWAMCVAGVVMAVNNVQGNIALAAGAVRRWILSDWVLAASLLLLTVALVPKMGVDGLALSYLAAYTLSVLVLLWRHGHGGPPSRRTA